MSDFDPPVIVESPRADSLASFGVRAGAWFLDAFLIALPTILILKIIGVEIQVQDAETRNLLVTTLLFNFLFISYNTFFVARQGSTLGMKIAGIKVVTRVDGGSVSISFAAIRVMVPALAGLIPLLGFAAIIVVYLRAVFHSSTAKVYDNNIESSHYQLYFSYFCIYVT